MEITREIAAKVLEVVDAGLVSGMGKPIPGQMCVEAAVCYAMGLPHSDDPKCVAPILRSLKIRLNDSTWSSDKARANGLRRLALAQLGSRNVLDEKEFSSGYGSLNAKNDLIKNGFSVCIHGSNGLEYPIRTIGILPASVTKKLTDDYDVVIYRDKVEVGCQTITKETITDLLLQMELL